MVFVFFLLSPLSMITCNLIYVAANYTILLSLWRSGIPLYLCIITSFFFFSLKSEEPES